MKVGPKYKIARRLGADIFEKTQTQKYAMRAGRGGKFPARGYSRSSFGIQLREKQRARMAYGIGERQFSHYVRAAAARKGIRDDEALYRSLETRLDNVIYRLGFAPTRQAARQFVSHGHFLVNGRRITVPSFAVSTGDLISVRPGSSGKTPFLTVADTLRDKLPPSWIRYDSAKSTAVIVGEPKFSKSEFSFNLSAILEYYRR